MINAGIWVGEAVNDRLYLADDRVVSGGGFYTSNPVAWLFFVGLSAVLAIGLCWLSFFTGTQDRVRRELRIMIGWACAGMGLFLGALSWLSFWEPGMSLQGMAATWWVVLPFWVGVLSTWASILRIWYLIDLADQMQDEPARGPHVQWEDVTPD